MTANAGYHAYATGDVLTAAQVQYNLQNQTVMYFATTSARTTAIGSVTVEGMVTYIPANGLEYYNGTAWTTVSNPGDITDVLAGKGLTGGGTSGSVTLALGTTAKGDLVAGTGTTTAAALTVGSDGSTLVADSSTSTGLRYSPAPAVGNPVLNSSMQNWQRGTSIAIAASTSTPTYSADRWSHITNANQAVTISRQVTNDTTNLPFIQYAMRYQRNSGQTGTAALYTAQAMETVNSIPLAGKAVILSFYARAGANYSAASSGLLAMIRTGTGTDQNSLTSYTGDNTSILTTVTLTTTWQRFTLSGTIPTTATEISPLFGFTPVGTASTNDYYEVTGVQIDIGSVALPFRTYAGTLQGELAACQRYYWRQDGTNSANAILGTGSSSATTTIWTMFKNPVNMRVKPTSVDSSSYILSDLVNSNIVPSAITLSTYSTETFSFINNTVTGATQYRPYYGGLNNSTSGYIGFSAEL